MNLLVAGLDHGHGDSVQHISVDGGNLMGRTNHWRIGAGSFCWPFVLHVGAFPNQKNLLNRPHACSEIMTDFDFSEDLILLIRMVIPAFAAAEVLVFMVQNSDEAKTASELAEALRPSVIGVSVIEGYLAAFKARELVREEAPQKFRYSPATTVLDQSARALVTAFNERPVTLIRAIYTLADSKIQSFADSFRLRD
jgi:hypothetical protein